MYYSIICLSLVHSFLSTDDDCTDCTRYLVQEYVSVCSRADQPSEDWTKLVLTLTVSPSASSRPRKAQADELIEVIKTFRS